MRHEGQPLRQRISAELTRLIGGYVLLISTLLALCTLLLGYYFKLNQLAYHQGLVATRLGTELRSFARELQTLASAPLLGTALSDSHGRDLYLLPVLSRFRRDGLRELLVLDYRGRLVQDPAGRAFLREHAAVRQAVDSGNPAHGMVPAESGLPALLLVYPVMLPELDVPVGFVVGTFDAQALLATMALGSIVPALALGDAPLQPPPPAGLMLRERSQDLIGPGEADLRLTVVLSEPLLPSLLLGLLGVLGVFLLGQWTLSRVAGWAGRFSAATTERLDHLVASCQRVLAGLAPGPMPQGPRDEISQVVDTLATMLRQQKQASDELRTTSLVFATAAEGIVVTDARGAVTQVNPALLRLTGFDSADVIGRAVHALCKMADGPAQIAHALELQGRWSGESTLLDRRGRGLDTAVSVSQIEDEQGVRTGQVWVFTDVSRLKRAEKQLREMAYIDGLTRLPNLRMMGEMVQQRLAASSQPCVLLFLDLDHLKQVNDSHGHEAGDWMIRGMAEHLRRHLPAGHLLCRRSGDEFIALVERDPGRDPDGWQALLARLSRATVMLPAGPLSVSATVGVARYPADALTWPELQACADVAMHAAKLHARGSSTWYEPRLGQGARRQRQVHQGLAAALAQQRIEVHYQPVFDLASGRVLGVEALARWTDAELGEVQPAEFFAVAEEAQWADALSLQLLKTVLRDKPRIEQRFAGASLAFNVAPQALCAPALVDFLADRAAQEPGALARLELELTETQMASGEDGLLASLQRLVDLGVGLVIDDFGTGHSSLGRLAQFPISGLKIDASFVAGLGQGRHQSIVALIVELARVLQLQLTAEGVETLAQREALLLMGCTRGQGWLYARALPLPELLRMPTCLAPSPVPVAAASP